MRAVTTTDLAAPALSCVMLTVRAARAAQPPGAAAAMYAELEGRD